MIPTWFRMILFIPTHIAVERIYPFLVRFAHSGVIILTTATSVGISLSHFKTMCEPYNIYGLKLRHPSMVKEFLKTKQTVYCLKVKILFKFNIDQKSWCL